MKQAMTVPDVTGYILEAAESILKQSGVKSISVTDTFAPVRGQKYSAGPATTCRVLRQKQLASDSVELVTGMF